MSKRFIVVGSGEAFEKGGRMKFAYADPPYIGCAGLYPEKREVDHMALISRLVEDFPDGWALSCHTPSLRFLLPLCPEDCRVGAWVKPFASFKPNVNPGYCWEPVIWRGGRKRERKDATIRDFLSESIALRKGLVGAKPEAFCRWVLALLGTQEGDEVTDLFPGTGVMGRVAEEFTQPIWMATPRREEPKGEA